MYKSNTNPATAARSIGGGGRVGGATLPSGSSWGTSSKTLADYVKESAAWSQQNSSAAAAAAAVNSIHQQQQNHHHQLHLHQQQQQNQHNPTTSMPWAAAVKAPPDSLSAAAIAAAAAVASANSAFDYNNSTIGSWSSPETSSSNRAGGWNADGSLKSDGTFDDGTAIWGNPTQKKTGVDWTEKESSLNPQFSQANSDKSQRIQKSEPVISSLNGTEAWGVPMPTRSSPQQQQNGIGKNDISGNTYGQAKSNNININNSSSSAANEPQLSWGGEQLSPTSSSLSSRNLHQQQATNGNSSPPNVSNNWGGLGATITNKPKSSADWLAGGPSSVVNGNASQARLDELNKQIESSSLFDSISKSSSGNSNLEHHLAGLSLAGNASGAVRNNSGLMGANQAINDLKQQMSANSFSNDLLDPSASSSNRQVMSGNLVPGGGSSNNSSNNNQSQLDLAAAYASSTAPSRDLLKQMVHQIQLAVQAGHLNAHILNQPMSAQTLQLVYQLLQQIKFLHQLQEIHLRSGGGGKSDLSGSPGALEVQINRIRQNISLLQKAITHQQEALSKNDDMKQQQQQQRQAAAAMAAAQAAAVAQAANEPFGRYASAISKQLSTNSKVPPSNMSNIIGNNSNLDSFRRSSLIDTLTGNSNSDSLRSAQATFEANATLDKTLSSLIQQSASPSANNNILGNGNKQASPGDYSKAQQSGFSNQNTNNKGSSSSNSAASNAWMAFNSGDFISSGSGWSSRISSNVSQEQQQASFNNDLDQFGNGKGWRGVSSSLLSDDKDDVDSSPPSLAPGSSLRSNASSVPNNILKQLNENDFLSRSSGGGNGGSRISGGDSGSPFYDWGNNSDSQKRSFDSGSLTSSSGNSSSMAAFSNSTGNSGNNQNHPSAIGSLSLQSNPWLFGGPTNSSLLNMGVDNMTKNNTNSNNLNGGNLTSNNKMDNGENDTNKAANSLFNNLKQQQQSSNTNQPGNIQRSTSALYDWSDLANTSALQFNNEQAARQKQQQQQQAAAAASLLGNQRPTGPPPGLMNNFRSTTGASAASSSANGISILDSKESASSLWSSGTWFD